MRGAVAGAVAMLGQLPRVLRWALGLGVGALGTAVLLRWGFRRRLEAKIAQALAQREQQLRQMEATLRSFWQKHPDASPKSIVSLSLLELTQKLQEGTLSPELVLHSYLEQAVRTQRDRNCLTGFPSDWEQQLQELHQRPHRGPLYGVPVSLKDNYQCQGVTSTCGLVAWMDRPAKEDCVIAKVLKSQGAVVFAKTNVPQAMMSYNSFNPVFGWTLHPKDPQKMPGGSSSGEAVLIASGGSILGMGSDLGGSIRLPASLCGVCGFKVTSARLSSLGVLSAMPGQSTVMAALGPMARDVDSLVLCLRALLCAELFRLDPTVPPLPFNDQLYSCSEPLRIGYCEEFDSLSPTLPCMRRVLQQSRELLERAGHKTDSMTFHFFYGGILADGLETLSELLRDEKRSPSPGLILELCRLPVFLRRLLSVLLRPWVPRLAKVMKKSVGLRSVRKLWELQVALKTYKHEVIRQWTALELDVLLCPSPCPAYNLSAKDFPFGQSSYTCLYNVLDFPAGTLPVSTVTEEDEAELQQFFVRRGRSSNQVFASSVGLPLSVQCVALPWQEEKALRLMKEVETLMGAAGEPRPPRPPVSV
ncbi:vitamin D3 hydroxylase-associated protein-like isoform X2 [Sorex fumeus]|uniref:vitamin D3 hydroxylase-associated protein-like isoform X2 n=1 Tax=Sorex fumeus TaxID=62283 RepID=UPI0024ADF650|nr:vitamin D3 hydroxylase-associated protein-like isoform X2 [Sorex fumeus]